MEDQNNNNNNKQNPNKKDIPKIGPKLQNNKQCNKKQQNSTLMFLSNSKIQQEEILREKRLEKTRKHMRNCLPNSQVSSESQIEKENCLQDEDQEILFYEEKQNIMEEDEDENIFIEEEKENNSNIYGVKSRNRQQRYNQLYGQYEDQNLIEQEVDLSNCLKNHKIPSILRSKMVDWTIEVFGNYKQTSTDKTYFRALGLLDLFFKKSTKKLVESDVHLFGIAAMFLASKQEDITHISLDDIVGKVGHNKFSSRVIREAEFEILRTLDMRIDFPTAYTFLTRYLYKIFSSQTNQIIIQLTQFSVYILKQCIHDEKLFNFKTHILGFSSIVVSLKVYYSNLKGQSNEPHHELVQQEIQIVQKIFELIDLSEHQNAKFCINELDELFYTFGQRYPDLKNLDRFHI